VKGETSSCVFIKREKERMRIIGPRGIFMERLMGKIVASVKISSRIVSFSAFRRYAMF
jgi:hypothetical protein